MLRSRGRQSRRFILLLISGIITVFFIVVFTFRNQLKNDSFLEIKKCPACYGISYCKPLLTGKVSFDGWHQLSPFRIFNVKNVYFANRGKANLVLKKLGHDKELKVLDRQICDSADQGKHCDVSKAIFHSQFKKTVQTPDRLLLKHLTLDHLSDSMSCPSQRLIDRMVEKYTEKVQTTKQHKIGVHEKLMMITTLMINPEPIIMQTFPASEDWPFPEYIGACGRYIVEEYSGLPLTSFYNAPWEKRVNIAHQLFQFAEKFTFNDLDFALYWTDLSYDNVAVTPEGAVTLIDVENIIVVDKQKIADEKPAGYQQPMVAEFDECKTKYSNCLSFSSDDLCSRLHSDHNYYALCRNLLSSYASEIGRPNGLLHNMPQLVKQKYNLDKLLDECAKPSKPNGRMHIKDSILDVLGEIDKTHSKSPEIKE